MTGANGKRKRNLQRPKTRIEKRKCCNLGDYAASGYSRQRKYNLRPVTTYFPDNESDPKRSLSYFLKRGNSPGSVLSYFSVQFLQMQVPEFDRPVFHEKEHVPPLGFGQSVDHAPAAADADVDHVFADDDIERKLLI